MVSTLREDLPGRIMQMLCPGPTLPNLDGRPEEVILSSLRKDLLEDGRMEPWEARAKVRLSIAGRHTEEGKEEKVSEELANCNPKSHLISQQLSKGVDFPNILARSSLQRQFQELTSYENSSKSCLFVTSRSFLIQPF